MELTNRQNGILKIIVGMYVKTVTPVGSRTISQCYQDALSPATIRNEMHDLEEKGYIKQPHTSAGRIPTDKGYRCYVDSLDTDTSVAPHVASLIAREYRERMDNMETLFERTSKILSSFSEQAGLVVFPMFEGLTLKRIELTALSPKHLLVVWVTSNGFVQDKIISLKEEIPSADLERINRLINEKLSGVLLSEIRSTGVLQYASTEKEDVSNPSMRLYKTANRIIADSLPDVHDRRLALEGSRLVLDQPEFHDWEKSRMLFKTLEAKDFLTDLVETSSHAEGVHVQIGLEHHCENIWDCSFVTAEYRVHQKRMGTLGVLGPRRMPYERVIALVDYVSRRFGEALEQWF